MARFGAAIVADADAVEAAEQASTEALAQLSSRSVDLAFVFATGPEPDALAAAGERAAAVCGARAAIGCTAPGVIGPGAAVEGVAAIAVWCASLPAVRVRSFHLEVLPAESGMAVVGMPELDADDEIVVLLADPWSFPTDGFVARSTDALAGVPLVGGVATGPAGRGSTRLFVNGSSVDRGAVGVVLGGPVGADVVVSQGCRPVGPAMTVTAADGNVILELAGVPALEKLEEIIAALDPDAQALATAGLQLGIAIDEYVDDHGRGDFVVRGIAGADGARSGLVVSDLVNVGTTVQLQLRDPAAAQDDLRYTLRRWQEQAGARSVDGALLFSAIDQRGVFSTARRDVAVVRDLLGVDAVGGFFTAGEMAPTGGRNRLHGLSSVVLMFGSVPAGPRRVGRGPAAAD